MADALKDAAGTAAVPLPERISLPLSFTTSDDPTASIAVFSGTARAKLADAEFAAEDTAATGSGSITAELAALKAAEKAEAEAVDIRTNRSGPRSGGRHGSLFANGVGIPRRVQYAGDPLFRSPAVRAGFSSRGGRWSWSRSRSSSSS
jgi:hypothetical protein